MIEKGGKIIMKSNAKIYLLTIAAIFLILFASCGGEQQQSETNTENEAAPIDADKGDLPQELEISEFEPAGADYGGYKFRILGYDGKASATWQVTAFSEIIADQETGDPINDAIYRRNREVESLYNVEFDIVPVTYPQRDQFATLFTKAVMAGDDLFDAAYMLGISLPTVLSRNNMTVNLWEIPTLDLSKSWWDQNSAKSMSIGGKLNAVVGDVNLYSATASITVFANKKIMQDYSIDNLYQLVREGKWTWDAMYDVMKRVTKDLDGDGVIDYNDQVGLFMQYLHLYDSLISMGEPMTPKNDDDIPVFAPNMDRVAAIADKLVPIFNDKNTTVESGKITGYNNPFFDFIMPKFRDGEIMFHINQLLLSFELRSMEADFALLPVPKYDESQEKYGSVISQWWSTFTVVPITCTDIDRTGNILDALGYYAQQYITPAYYGVTVTNKLMRDEDSLEMMEIIINNRNYDLAYYYDWGGIQALITGVSSSGNPGTIISQFEKNEPKITAAIQRTLDELELN